MIKRIAILFSVVLAFAASAEQPRPVGPLGGFSVRSSRGTSASLADWTAQLDQTANRRIPAFAYTIRCYGDSNTSYYEGDTSTVGPKSKSACAQLDANAGRYPFLWGATIDILGNPGQTSADGVAGFAAIVGTPAIMVLGWGTNDIKVAAAPVAPYLANMRTMIEASITAGAVPIILGIPWFDATYAADGATGQARIPVWNGRLRRLAAEYRVPFVDAYAAEAPGSTLFYNETVTAKRHLNADGQRMIMQKLIAAIGSVLTDYGSGFATTPAIYRASFSTGFMPELVNAGTSSVLSYVNGGRTFPVLKIPAGTSITLAGAGRFSIGFYPRLSATATFDKGSTANLTITAVSDGAVAEWYPIARVYSGSSLSGTSYNVVVGAVGADIFVRYWAFEDMPTIGNQYRAAATIDLASIAANVCGTDQTITVTGAVVGADCVVGSPAALTAGLIQTCYVSATDTVKLRTCNSTAGAIDQASASYSVRVFNP